MTTFSQWLAGGMDKAVNPTKPLRPANAMKDIEERTVQPGSDYATEAYETDFGHEVNEEDALGVYLIQPPPSVHIDTDWHASTHTVSDTSIQIMARNRNRTRAVVRNLDAALSVYLGRESMVHGYLGYTLAPGAELELTHNDAVWCKAATDDCLVTVMQEFTLDEQYDIRS